MELQLKHIAPYLPYGLKIDTSYYDIDESDYEIQGKCDYPVVSGIDLRGENLFCYYSTNQYGKVEQEYAMEHIKPILRNLSDLTKEIEVNGERFVPKYKIPIELDEKLDFETCSSVEGGFKNIDSFEIYECYQKLFEWHFDVFGLIENGLAIDINTLKD